MHVEDDGLVHHKKGHVAERLERIVPMLMVVAIVLLAIGMVYGIMTTDSTPSWMR
jgi:cell division protein FtsL